MTEDRDLVINLADEIDIIIHKHIKDSNRVVELQNICGLDEPVSPYDDMIRQLEFVKEYLIPEKIEEIKFLIDHKHEDNGADYCLHCGADLKV